MEKTLGLITEIVAALVAIALVGFICAFPTMWLWNYVMPYLFGLPIITFWQALAIDILGQILFGGIL